MSQPSETTPDAPKRAKPRRKLPLKKIATGSLLAVVTGALVWALASNLQDDKAPLVNQPQAPQTVTPQETSPEPTLEPSSPATSATPTGEPTSPDTVPTLGPQTPVELPTPVDEEFSFADVPTSFPLPEGTELVGKQNDAGITVLTFTVPDSAAAVKHLDNNLMENGYYIILRQVSGSSATQGRFKVMGPQLPENSEVIIKDDNTMTIRIAEE